MKKSLLSILFSCIALVGFSQTNETITEEKASEWVVVPAMARPVARNINTNSTNTKTVTRPATNSAAASQKPPAQKPSASFNKTNQRVKRFKKS